MHARTHIFARLSTYPILNMYSYISAWIYDQPDHGVDVRSTCNCNGIERCRRSVPHLINPINIYVTINDSLSIIHVVPWSCSLFMSRVPILSLDPPILTKLALLSRTLHQACLNLTEKGVFPQLRACSVAQPVVKNKTYINCPPS